ncbi:MAG: hypothetical protein ACYCW6_00250 [Candidatus Xenobia bacterium]
MTEGIMETQVPVPEGIPHDAQRVFLVGVIYRSHADPIVHVINGHEVSDDRIRAGLQHLENLREAARKTGNALEFMRLNGLFEELKGQLWETSLPRELVGQHREVLAVPAPSPYWAARTVRENLQAAAADVHARTRHVSAAHRLRAICARLVQRLEVQEARLRRQGREQEADDVKVRLERLA